LFIYSQIQNKSIFLVSARKSINPKKLISPRRWSESCINTKHEGIYLLRFESFFQGKYIQNRLHNHES
jgi:hypothetical protein